MKSNRASESKRPLPPRRQSDRRRSEEHTSELQSHSDLVCRLLLEKKKPAVAEDEKKLVGTYRLVERIPSEGGAKLHPPEVLGSMTFTKTSRTLILKVPKPDGSQVS